MEKRLGILLLAMLFSFYSFSQSKVNVTSGLEMIFSMATIDDNGNSGGSVFRCAPVFNFQSMVNLDLNQKFGLFSGFAIRNVGYIYNNFRIDPKGTANPEDNIATEKFRTYNVGIPLGIKIGNHDKAFFYAGYEVELPVFYKEKTIDRGDKLNKINEFFSDRVEQFQHGFLAGLRLSNGFDLKFKYYVSNFNNKDFVGNNGYKPYAGLDAHVFYVSIGAYMFKGSKFSKPLKPSKEN